MNFSKILSFLADLKKNNNREWFEKNKPVYQEALKEYESVIKYLIDHLGKVEPGIADLKPKDCIFRIYRDVRFSKDKSPYKPNFGAAISRGGRKSPYALYYLHLEDGGSFLAGGIYMPPNDLLAKVRQEIDYNAGEFREIIQAPDFKKYFGELGGDKLKKAPKGYSPDDENIELLKHKSYIAMHYVSNEEVMAKAFPEKMTKVMLAMKPMNDFINRALD